MQNAYVEVGAGVGVELGAGDGVEVGAGGGAEVGAGVGVDVGAGVALGRVGAGDVGLSVGVGVGVRVGDGEGLHATTASYKLAVARPRQHAATFATRKVPTATVPYGPSKGVAGPRTLARSAVPAQSVWAGFSAVPAQSPAQMWSVQC